MVLNVQLKHWSFSLTSFKGWKSLSYKFPSWNQTDPSVHAGSPSSRKWTHSPDDRTKCRDNSRAVSDGSERRALISAVRRFTTDSWRLSHLSAGAPDYGMFSWRASAETFQTKRCGWLNMRLVMTEEWGGSAGPDRIHTWLDVSCFCVLIGSVGVNRLSVWEDRQTHWVLAVCKCEPTRFPCLFGIKWEFHHTGEKWSHHQSPLVGDRPFPDPTCETDSPTMTEECHHAGFSKSNPLIRHKPMTARNSGNSQLCFSLFVLCFNSKKSTWLFRLMINQQMSTTKVLQVPVTSSLSDCDTICCFIRNVLLTISV